MIDVNELLATKPAVTTQDAAAAFGRKPQTLRKWHCHRNGLMQPFVLGGRLMWSTAEIKRLLGVA